MPECKILSFSFDSKHNFTDSFRSSKTTNDGVRIDEFHGYETEVNKYLASGWKVAGLSHDASGTYIILVK